MTGRMRFDKEIQISLYSHLYFYCNICCKRNVINFALCIKKQQAEKLQFIFHLENLIPTEHMELLYQFLWSFMIYSLKITGRKAFNKIMF